MEQAHYKAMALADGELNAAELPAVIQELARNPSLMRTLQIYFTVRRRRLAQLYDTKREEQPPQWLVDIVKHAPLGEAASDMVRFKSLGLVEWLKSRYAMPRWSWAAGPAFAAIVTALCAWLLVPTSSHSATILAARLQQAIETTPEGDNPALVSFRPVLTFKDKDNTYCRQFELRSDSERSGAYACRTGEGHWQIVMQTPPAGLMTMAPAGALDLNRAVTERRLGPPLDEEEVKRLAASGWKQK